MYLLGANVFWPTKNHQQKNDHALWGKLGRFSTSQPFLGLLLVLIVTIPLFLTFENQRSFHSLDEIDDQFGSVKAFRLIEENFGEGDFFYHNLIIETESPTWDHPQRISYIELLSKNLLKIDDVTEVRSVTRPEGEKLSELRIYHQADEAVNELDEVSEGIAEMKAGVNQMATELDKALEELKKGESELIKLIEGTEDAQKGAHELHQGISEINQAMGHIAWQVSQAQNDVETYYNVADSIHQVILGYTDILTPILDRFEEIVIDISELSYGLYTISQGLDELEKGSNELKQGLGEINQGQKILLNQYNELILGLEELLDGLIELDGGFIELEEGIGQMEDLLLELSDQEDNVLSGFFIPKEIYNEEFPKAWENYGTPNNNVAIIQIVGDTNPYGSRAMDMVGEIEEITEFTLKNTPYEEVRFAVDGVPSQNRDLKVLSRNDFIRTSIYMLTGIFIVLSILFKSLVMPIYAMISLAVAYIASQSIVEFIFIDILGYPGIMWSVPFFAFVMLMSMGVDYSIFLLARFNEEIKEYDHRSPENIKKAMTTAMRKVGGAVFSAATILASSFAAMMLSGVLSLLQIGTWVIVGLAFYVIFLLPIFIPAIATYLGEYNWWPFSIFTWDSDKGMIVRKNSKTSTKTKRKKINIAPNYRRKERNKIKRKFKERKTP